MKDLISRTFLFVTRYVFPLTLVSCALPVSEDNLQSFVPQVDLQVVSLTREGLDYYSRGRFIDAEFRFLEALKLTPNVENINFNLALTLMEEGEYLKAEKILQNILESEQSSTKVMAALARLYVSKNEYEKAIVYYKEALNVALLWREFPRATNFSRSISVLYFLLGQENKALEYSELALSIADNAEEMCKHGKLLIATGKYKEAEEKTLKFINDREAKKDPCLTANLALVAYVNNDFSDVSKYCEMVMNFRKTEIETSNLVKLLQFFSDQKLKEEKNENNGVVAEDNSENGLDNEESPLMLYQDGEPLETNFALFWPITFLDSIKVESEKISLNED